MINGMTLLEAKPFFKKEGYCDSDSKTVGCTLFFPMF